MGWHCLIHIFFKDYFGHCAKDQLGMGLGTYGRERPVRQHCKNRVRVGDSMGSYGDSRDGEKRAEFWRERADKAG